MRRKKGEVTTIFVVANEREAGLIMNLMGVSFDSMTYGIE